MKNRILKILEISILFVLLPLVANHYRVEFKLFIIPLILLLSVFCLYILMRDENFNRKNLGFKKTTKNKLRKVLFRVVFGFMALIVFVYLFDDSLLFSFPQQNFRIWLIVIILYPFLSVYPQELIFRTFIFHRYKNLFNSKIQLIIFSSAAFGFAHIIYGNFIAVILSTLGGFIFANTYSKSKSTILVSIEHGIWGDIIFTVGLGMYFYSGAIT